MWASRKQPSDLRLEEQRILRKLWKWAPKLKLAYNLREQLTATLDLDISKAVAKRVHQSGLNCFDKFLKTLDP